MTANDDRPGGGAEATKHNTHSHGPEADTLDAEAPADDGDDFRHAGQQAEARGAVAVGDDVT